MIATDTITKPFLLTPPKPTANQEAMIQKLHEKATRALELKEESFQRCDTDGFLTQWAHGLTAQLEDRKVEILKNGGYAKGYALFEGDRVVAAKLIESKFGMCWMLSDSEKARFGRKFIPMNGYDTARSRIQKKLGLHEGTIWQPAWASVMGRGTGLSGHAWVGAFVVEKPNYL